MTALTGKKLTDAEVSSAIQDLKGWELKNGEIVKTFKFESFIDAISFVNEVADLADELDHHPDMLIQYNKVTLTLSTHSAGGLTDKDFFLASEIETPENSS